MDSTAEYSQLNIDDLRSLVVSCLFHSARPLSRCRGAMMRIACAPLGQHDALVLFVLLPGLGVDFGQMQNLVAGVQAEVDAIDVALPVAYDGVAEDCPLLRRCCRP